MTATTVRPETAVKRPAIRVEYRPHPARAFLQRQAPRNIMRHCMRDAWRTGVLVASDLMVYAVLHRAVSGVRAGVLGERLAEWTLLLFPSGFLGGWRFAIALLISLLVAGAYGAGDKRRDTGRLVAGINLASLLALYASVWVNPLWQVGVQYLCTVILLGLTLVPSRILLDSLVRRVRTRVGGARAILVARAGHDWREIAKLVKPSREFLFVGSVRLGGAPADATRAELLQLGDLIDQHRADTVLLWGDLSEREFSLAVDLALASGCELLSGPRNRAAVKVEPRAVWLNGTPLIKLTAPTLMAWQYAFKRSFDIVAATIGLVACAPLFALVALLIRRESKGPVFFRQWRVGRAGKPFEIYKFRSMYSDAEQRLESLRSESIYEDERLFKVVNDPRVTRVGRILRRTSIDELPQLLNVLRGDMSLVGPRPPTLNEVELYEEHHYCRFDMKPGITGPWQVNGRNKVTEFEEVVRLERAYTRDWSIATDLKILIKTVPVVLRMDGAH
jgi:exopolysaccharide biosynthesis polyprenyl glycosylphosphotransferase